MITFTITIIIIIIFRIFSPPTRDVPQFQSSPTTPVKVKAILKQNHGYSFAGSPTHLPLTFMAVGESDQGTPCEPQHVNFHCAKPTTSEHLILTSCFNPNRFKFWMGFDFNTVAVSSNLRL